MKYTYRFITGETRDIEVDEEQYIALKEADRCDYNNDHTETRRHVHIDAEKETGGDWLAVEDAALVALEEDSTFRYLLSCLTSEQQALVHKVYVEGYCLSEIAEAEGVSKMAVTNRMTKIQKRLKKYLEGGLLLSSLLAGR